MTVLFKEIDHSGIGYKILGTKPTTPKIGRLKCDKISLTIDTTQHEREALKLIFTKMVANTDCWKTFKKGGYHHSYKISLKSELHFGGHGQESILIQFEPHMASYNYMRVEFNPDKVNLGKVKVILDNILPNGYNRIINGKVTRFDETVLIHFCKIDDLLFYYPNLQASATYKSLGKVETEYLGSIKASSEKIFCLYDKTKEIKVKNAKVNPVIEDKEPVPEYEIVRVEYRYKPKSKNFTLEDLKLKESPLKKLIISEYFNLDAIESFSNKEEQSHFKLFLDSCRYRGIQQAYKLLTDSKRKKYRKIVNGAKAKWWDGQDISNQRTPLIEWLLNPKPEPLGFYSPAFAINCTAPGA